MDKRNLTGNVWSFRLHPELPLSWQAGQFIRVGLAHPQSDTAGTTRWFTIAAAPHIGDVIITTRLTGSSFKRALAELKVGESAQLVEAPAGDFTWRDSPRPHIFAAQGIGITPFYAIITDRIHRGLPVPTHLIYAHQPGSEAVFGDQFNDLAVTDSGFQVSYLEGVLTPAKLVELAPDYYERFVYVSGPKSFVSLAIAPNHLPISQLKQDNFPGYAAGNY